MSGTYNIVKQSRMIILSRGYTICSMLSSTGMAFILLIKKKMSTIVGILIFISGINTTFWCFKQDFLV